MKRKKRMAGLAVKTILFAAVIGLFLTAGNANAEEIKIVSIKTGEVLQSHPAFREAVGKYQAKQQEMQKKLSEAKEEERTMLQTQAQQELQQIGMQLQKEATDKMTKDVQNLAKENGYDYVVDADMLIVGTGPDVPDITGQVIKSFSEEAK
jgi:Skp family chaperone for outer membrane proteins